MKKNSAFKDTNGSSSLKVKFSIVLPCWGYKNWSSRPAEEVNQILVI